MELRLEIQPVLLEEGFPSSAPDFSPDKPELARFPTPGRRLVGFELGWVCADGATEVASGLEVERFSLFA